MKKRYTKGNLIGSGSFKSVYEGYDNVENRAVAYNEVSLLGLNNQKKERIYGEVQMLKSLNHERVLPIYDAWVTDTHLRFTTEMMSCSLSDHIRRISGIRISDLKKWATQILSGLEYLHSLKIVHRDLKCENIFLDTASSSVKIGDFGLSISVRDKKFAVSLIGTPNYLAPECLEEEYDEKIDIWAYGMCILELFTGEHPYSEFSTPLQVIKAIMEGKKPQSLQTVTNPLCKEFIETCLKFKEDRPSATDLKSHPFLKENKEQDSIIIKYPIGPSSHLFSVRSLESEVRVPRNTSTTQNIKKKIKSKKDKSTIAVVESMNGDLALIAVYISLKGQYKKVRISFDKKHDSIEQIALDLQAYFAFNDKKKNEVKSAMIEALSVEVDNDSESTNEIKSDSKFNSSSISTKSSNSSKSEESKPKRQIDARNSKAFPDIEKKNDNKAIDICEDKKTFEEASKEPFFGESLDQNSMSKIIFLDKLRALDMKNEAEIEKLKRKIKSLKIEKRELKKKYSLERAKLIEEFLFSGKVEDFASIFSQIVKENTPILNFSSENQFPFEENTISPSMTSSSIDVSNNWLDEAENTNSSTPNNLDLLFSEFNDTSSQSLNQTTLHPSTLYAENSTVIPVSPFNFETNSPFSIESNSKEGSKKVVVDVFDVFDQNQDLMLEHPALQPQKITGGEK